jgi:hypothetical protein
VLLVLFIISYRIGSELQRRDDVEVALNGVSLLWPPQIYARLLFVVGGEEWSMMGPMRLDVHLQHRGGEQSRTTS